MSQRTGSTANSALAAIATGGILILLALVCSPSAQALTLFEHSTGASAQSTPSQNLEPANDSFDSEIADDFTVPQDKTWRLEEIFARGLKNGANVAGTANVKIYADGSGTPGTLMHDDVLSIRAGTYPRLELPYSVKPVLPAGTYWLGVQVNMPGSPDTSQWFWADNPNQSGSPAVFRNPGNGFLSGCTAFTARNTCAFGVTPANPEADQMFRLTGT
ncbi:MAG: hypothetical protein WBW44_10670, partial [Solirubrobacterales bacterium]